MTSLRTLNMDHLGMPIDVRLNYDWLKGGKREHLPPSYNSGQRTGSEPTERDGFDNMHALHEFLIGRMTVNSDNLF